MIKSGLQAVCRLSVTDNILSSTWSLDRWGSFFNGFHTFSFTSSLVGVRKKPGGRGARARMGGGKFKKHAETGILTKADRDRFHADPKT